MKKIEDIKVTGEVTLVHYDEFGNITNTQVKNMVVTTGLDYIASRMIGTAMGVMTHMALGSSNAAPALTQTSLSSQLGTRAVITSSNLTPTNKQITYVSTFAAGIATGAVVEAGIFNASTAGQMLCRTIFDVINKGVNDTLAITWVITVS